MTKNYKILKGISIGLGLLGLIAILFSIFSENNDHSFALAIGLGLTAVANLINYLANKELKK